MENEEKEEQVQLTKRQIENLESKQLVKEAQEAAARIEEANKSLALLIEKQNALKNTLKREEIFSGSAEAGSAPKSTEEKEIEEARKMLAGTGYDEILFPKK